MSSGVLVVLVVDGGALQALKIICPAGLISGTNFLSLQK